MVYLKGSLTERETLSELLVYPLPLKLNLAELHSINSLGVRSLLSFIERWGAKEIEFHECSPVFLDCINTFPGLLGSPAKTDRVKSIYLFFQCDFCADQQKALVNLENSDFEPLWPSCPDCGGSMHLLGDKDDYTLFLRLAD